MKGITMNQIRDKTKLQIQLIKKILQDFEKRKTIKSFTVDNVTNKIKIQQIQSKIKHYVLIRFMENVSIENNSLFKDGNIDQNLMKSLNLYIQNIFLNYFKNNAQLNYKVYLKYWSASQVYEIILNDESFSLVFIFLIFNVLRKTLN